MYLKLLIGVQMKKPETLKDLGIMHGTLDFDFKEQPEARYYPVDTG